MKKPNSIQFILSAKKIISVNALYGAKLIYKGTRPAATMYKKSEAKKMEDYIKEQVKALDIPNNHPWINKNTKFKFTFTVIFKSGYFMRDLDNCCKNLIDGIFRALGYNDSHICEIHCYKTLCPSIPEEKICIEMSEFTGEARFDKLTEDIPSPKSIYLGGDSDISWKDELKKKLKINVTENKDDAECELYYLTPNMSDLYPFSEIINAAYETSIGGYGCLLVGIKGREEDWGKEKWISINKILNLVNDISSESNKIKAEFIESPVELLNYIKNGSKRKV